MRKIASIFLLLVLLFNLIGYRVWFFYAEKRSDFAFETRLDQKAYNDNELIPIIIPLHNPYQLEKNQFERINGEVNIGGRMYKYVMRKISDGNMTLLCIPDEHKTNLKKAQTELNGVNDIASARNNSSRENSKNINSSDYTDFLQDYRLSILFLNAAKYFNNHSHSLADPALASPGQPPEAIA